MYSKDLLRLEEEDGAVPEVEVDEVFRLCNMGSQHSPEGLCISSRTHHA